MNTNVLGTYMNCKESMHIEFKEFCLKHHIFNFLTSSQIHRMVHKGILPRNFDDIVINNLDRYIDIYLSKYACAFHNSHTNSNHPLDFIIGVDDNSEITGVPYSGCVNYLEDHLKQYINNHLQHTMKEYICCLKFDITIKECLVYPELLDDSYLAEQIERHNQIMNHYNICNKKYTKKRKQWIKNIMRYKGKLSTAVRDEAFMEELGVYLRELGLYERFEGCLNTKYEFDSESVKFYKDDPNHFMYWVISYKDKKAKEFMLIKPKAPSIQKLPNIEFCASTQLSMLRSRLLANNNRLKYYTICISISKDTHCTKKVRFKDYRCYMWRTMHRTIHKNEPHCYDIGSDA